MSLPGVIAHTTRVTCVVKGWQASSFCCKWFQRLHATVLNKDTTVDLLDRETSFVVCKRDRTLLAAVEWHVISVQPVGLARKL